MLIIKNSKGEGEGKKRRKKKRGGGGGARSQAVGRTGWSFMGVKNTHRETDGGSLIKC